jgi:hypothetical protein
MLPGLLRNIQQPPNIYNIRTAIKLISEIRGISVNEDNKTVLISYREYAW